MKDRGFTLVEILVVIACLLLLLMIVMPTLAQVARGSGWPYAQGEHNIFSGLLTYTSTNRNRMPPFAMSTYDGNVGMSGSWGGVEQTSDGDTPPPGTLARKGLEQVNLWTLVSEKLLSPQITHLSRGRPVGHFRQGRPLCGYIAVQHLLPAVPVQRRLFDDSPNLMEQGGKILTVYGQAAGGQAVRIGSGYQKVPIVPTDGVYKITDMPPAATATTTSRPTRCSATTSGTATIRPQRRPGATAPLCRQGGRRAAGRTATVSVCSPAAEASRW